VNRRSVDAPVRRGERINVPKGKRGRGRSKKSLDEVIRENLKVVGLTEDMTQDRRQWRDKMKDLYFRELAL